MEERSICYTQSIRTQTRPGATDLLTTLFIVYKLVLFMKLHEILFSWR